MLYMGNEATKRARLGGADLVADASTSVAEARRGFADIIERAQRGAAVHITRHNKPVAVLISAEEYEALTEERQQRQLSFGEFVRKWRAENADLLDDEFAELANAARDRSPAREFSF